MFFVYAIYNKNKDKIYIGCASNLDERLKRHNKILPNKSKSFTSKNSGLWELIHKEEFDSRQAAIKREKELKSYKGRVFVRSLIKN